MCPDAQDVGLRQASDVDPGAVDHATQPHAGSSTSESLLDGEDYDMEGSDDFIVDDLAHLDQDAEEFEALLAARMPMSSCGFRSQFMHNIRFPHVLPELEACSGIVV